MKKIVAFAGSNSSTSINHEFVLFAASKIGHHSVKTIRLTDYPLPLFGEDIERAHGYPEELNKLKNEISDADAVLMSVNEHNGSVSAYFKNTLDWLSRLEYKFLANKKVLVLSTSNGKRGALSALQYTAGVIPRYGGEVVASFAFPSFSENYSVEKKKIMNEALNIEFMNILKNFQSLLEQ